MNERRALTLVPLLFGVWFFGVLAPYGIQVGEDGDMLYQAYATWRGQLPYLDFSTGYTPLYFYWHALLFRLFGVDALVIRYSTAAANTLTLVLMYSLAARLVRPRLALLAPLTLLAGLQVFPGEFCAFNIPYPAWYCITLWLGSLAAVAGYAGHERRALLVLAGLLAGVSFSMKPNVGLFNVAALGVFLVWWQPPGRRDGVLARLMWWLLAFGTYAFVLVVFRAQLGQRAFVLFPLPVVAIIVLLLINAQQRRRDDSGFLPAALALGAGVVIPILPWALFFLGRLGVHGFLRDVLLIGTSYERFFFIPFRPVGTTWDVGLLLVGGALLVVPMLVRGGWLPAWLPLIATVAGGALAGTYLALFAPMRSGLVSSVAMRAQDLSFFVLQVVDWWAVWLAFRGLTRHDRILRTPALATLVLLMVSAPAFTLGMYPRSDFAHLIAVAPVAIVLGVVLLGRLAQRWRAMAPHGAYWHWAGPVLIAAPVAAIAIVMAVPSLQLATDMTARYLGRRGPEAFARLHLARASIVRRAGEGTELEVLHDTTAYLEANSGPDDYVFPFPNLSLLCFLAGRLNPTAKGYFIAGYPDHETEAELVQALATKRPRLVVALRNHELFVTTASMYYFLIREWVQREYSPSTQIGAYAVLIDRGSAGRAFVDPTVDRSSDACNTDRVDDPDPLVRLAVMECIRTRRDPRDAALLAARAAQGAPNARGLIQLTAEFGDERSMAPLAQIIAKERNTQDRLPVVSPTVDLAMSALYYIVDKAILADYWFVPPPAERRRKVASADLDADVLSSWLRDRDADARLRIAAAWVAAWRGDRTAVPHLLVMLGSSNLDVAKFAAYALIRLDAFDATAESLVALLHWEDIEIPSMLLDLYHRDPARVRPTIERGLVRGTLQEQVALSWIAAATGDQSLRPALVRLRDGGDPGLRHVAESALAVLDATKRPAEVS